MGRNFKWTRSLAERFEDQYIPEPNSGCWLWLGALMPAGYGSIKDNYRSRVAHRVRAAEGSNSEIGARFGVHRVTVYDIKRGRRWQHVQ